MAISEAARSDLYNGLRDVLGQDRAETLMSAIPLHHLDEVATKGDIAELREATRADIAELREATRADIAELREATRADIAELRSEIAELRAATRADIAELRSELKTEFTNEINGLRKSMTTWVLMLATANIGAVVSVALIAS